MWLVLNRFNSRLYRYKLLPAVAGMRLRRNEAEESGALIIDALMKTSNLC